jgi:MFS transporter, DHA1 family, multidrug resistance protein
VSDSKEARKGPPTVISRRHFTWLLAMMSMIGPFSTDTYIPAMKAMETALQTNAVALTQTLTVYFFAVAVMALWHGAISDAVGRRPVILASLAVYVAASAGCMLAPNVSTLIIFRALQGLAGGAGVVVGRAMIRDRFNGPDAQRMQSQVTLIFGLGPAIAPIVGGMLVAYLNWRWVFGFMLLMSAITFAGVYALMPETHPKEKRQPLNARALLTNYKRIFTTPQFQLLSASGSFAFGGLFVYIAAAPDYILKHLQLSEKEFFWIFGAFIAGLMTAAAISSRIAGRVPIRTQMRIGLSLATLGFVLNTAYAYAFSSPRVPWAVIPLSVYGVGLGLFSSATTLRLLDLFPTLRGTCSSLHSFATTMIAALAMGVVAPLVSHSMQTLAVTGVILLVIGIALWFVFDRWYRHVKPLEDK